MEHYKISKLLDNSIVAKFVTRRWIEVNDLSGGQYSVNKSIGSQTPMLTSHLGDYSDAYIVVKGTLKMLAKEIKRCSLIITLRLDHAYQKSITY